MAYLVVTVNSAFNNAIPISARLPKMHTAKHPITPFTLRHNDGESHVLLISLTPLHIATVKKLEIEQLKSISELMI